MYFLVLRLLKNSLGTMQVEYSIASSKAEKVLVDDFRPSVPVGRKLGAGILRSVSVTGPSQL